MASALSLFNGCQRLCKNPVLTSTSTSVSEPAVNALADVYSGAVQYMLEQAQWNFAKKSTSIAGSTASAGMGYAYGYTKPTDLVRFVSVSASTAYYPPVEHYEEDVSKLYGSDSTLYATFTSNSTSYGLNLAAWPETFAKATEAYLAKLVAPNLADFGKEDLDRIDGEFERRLAIAKAKDAINQTSRVVASSREDVYQGALRLIGFRPLQRFGDAAVQARLASLMPQGEDKGVGRPLNTETVELTARRMLDEVWDNAVAHVIQHGLWNWAQRSVAIDAATDVEPSFGFSCAFEIPDDFVRVVQIAGNDLFFPALDDFLQEGGYLNASVNPLYLIYVSNDTDRGTDMNIWPRSVKKVLEAYLALELGPTILPQLFSSSVAQARLTGLGVTMKLALRDAKSKDAMDQPPGKEAPGRLMRSRTAWRGNAWRERR